MRRFCLISAIALISIAFITTGYFSGHLNANAATLKFNYGGAVTTGTSDDTGQLATAGIGVGTTFSGFFEYDTDASSLFGITGFVTYPGINMGLDFATGQSATSEDETQVLVQDSGDDAFTFSATIPESDPISLDTELA